MPASWDLEFVGALYRRAVRFANTVTYVRRLSQANKKLTHKVRCHPAPIRFRGTNIVDGTDFILNCFGGLVNQVRCELAATNQVFRLNGSECVRSDASEHHPNVLDGLSRTEKNSPSEKGFGNSLETAGTDLTKIFTPAGVGYRKMDRRNQL